MYVAEVLGSLCDRAAMTSYSESPCSAISSARASRSPCCERVAFVTLLASALADTSLSPALLIHFLTRLSRLPDEVNGVPYSVNKNGRPGTISPCSSCRKSSESGTLTGFDPFFDGCHARYVTSLETWRCCYPKRWVSPMRPAVSRAKRNQRLAIVLGPWAFRKASLFCLVQGTAPPFER